MEKKDKKEKNTKKKYIIILLLLIAILLFFCYFKLYKGYQNLQNSNTSNIDDSEEKKDLEEEPEYLYKIVYIDPPNRSMINDTLTESIFFITKDYRIYSIQKTLNSDELASYTKKVDGEQTTYLDEIRVDLEKETPEEKIKLNRTQKFIVKTLLEEQTYIDNDENEFLVEQPMYYIINSELKSYFSNFDGSNSRLEILLRAFIYNDITYFDYLKNNNVTNFIQDKEYQELDIHSDWIKNLYQKVTIGPFDFSHYQEGKMTNSSIITWATYQYYLEQRAASWSLENLNEKNFDRYVKRIFGKNMDYDMDSYTGSSRDGCIVFSKYRVSFNSGCDEGETIYSDLAFAYEKDDKLVLIERTLFYASPTNTNSSPFTSGIGLYTDANVKVLVTDQYPLPYISSDFIGGILDLYNEFVTYYSYTFTKGNNSDYYLTDFNRLN